MSTPHRFQVMEAWQTARALTRSVFELTATGTFSRNLEFRDQLQRASISIPSNIAESFQSRTKVSSREFLRRAQGAAGELRAQLFAALDAGYLSGDQFRALQEQCAKCSDQLNHFIDGAKHFNSPASKTPHRFSI
jgi:four helix bundle protein